jgi:DNA-binding transcriptional MerR regulator
MGEKYLIHDISQLLGISPQTIRFYEERGLVSNTRNAETGYRYFNTPDISFFIRSRMYRSLGFNIKESADLLNNKSFEEIAAALKSRRKAMSKEIEWMQNAASHLEWCITLVETLKEKEGLLEFSRRPPLYVVLYRNGNSISKSAKVRKTVSRWMDFMPFPKSLVVLDMDDKRGFSEDYHFGLCVGACEAEFLKIKAEEPVFFLEGEPCIYSMGKPGATHEANYRNLTLLKKKIEKMGLRVTGPVYTRIVLTMNKSKNPSLVCEYWISYQKDGA